MAGKYKGNNTNRRNSKPNRSENLSTTIGDLLKSKGQKIPNFPPYNYNSKKRPYKNEKKKSTTEIKKEEKIAPQVEETPVEEPKKVTLEDIIKNGIDASKIPVPIDMSEHEKVEPVEHEGTWEEFNKLFTETEEERNARENPVVEKIHIGAEYITKDGTDKRVRTDEFITKKQE